MAESFPIILYLVVTCSVPVLAIWGWVRWARNTQPRTAYAYMSLAGFGLSNLSAMLAITTATYAHAIGGFAHYDPVLIDIYGLGLVLSMGGLACSLIGVFKPNPLRWHAPACALGMFVFWLLSTVRE
ncbi:MAG TPA: hypothetical protein VI685_29085 [Candidatus Angelobacter sp.]